jgi:hypothetical protein
LILSDFGHLGWGVSSPDLPGLVSGAAKREDLTDEFLFEIAREAGLEPGGSVDTLEQLVLTIDDEVYAVRAKKDFFFSERAALVFRTAKHVHDDEDLRTFVDRDSLGDAVFMVCLPRDSLSSMMSSIESGEPVTLVVERQETVQYLGLQHASPNDESDGRIALASLGFTGDPTIEELFARFDNGDKDLSRVDQLQTLVFA